MNVAFTGHAFTICRLVNGDLPLLTNDITSRIGKDIILQHLTSKVPLPQISCRSCKYRTMNTFVIPQQAEASTNELSPSKTIDGTFTFHLPSPKEELGIPRRQIFHFHRI